MKLATGATARQCGALNPRCAAQRLSEIQVCSGDRGRGAGGGGRISGAGVGGFAGAGVGLFVGAGRFADAIVFVSARGGEVVTGAGAMGT